MTSAQQQSPLDVPCSSVEITKRLLDAPGLLPEAVQNCISRGGEVEFTVTATCSVPVSDKKPASELFDMEEDPRYANSSRISPQGPEQLVDQIIKMDEAPNIQAVTLFATKDFASSNHDEGRSYNLACLPVAYVLCNFKDEHGKGDIYQLYDGDFLNAKSKVSLTALNRLLNYLCARSNVSVYVAPTMYLTGDLEAQRAVQYMEDSLRKRNKLTAFTKNDFLALVDYASYGKYATR